MKPHDIVYDNTTAAPCFPPRAPASMPGGSRACRCATGAIPWWILQTGAVMSLVRFGDPMGPLSKASLPFDRQGKLQQEPDVMIGAAFVSEIFAVSLGKIAENSAYRIPSEGNVKTPWSVGMVAVRDWKLRVTDGLGEVGKC